ncbi:MAG: response regulator transcription factor [Planctomycetota bacterium]
MNLLLADDDPGLRASLSAGLVRAGYAVATAENGALVEQLLSAGAPFDLLLLDVDMPELDGWGVLQRLRERGDSTPVVFLTGRSALDDRVRGLRSGADDYVVKPFELAELLARIEAVLRRNVPHVVYRDGTLRYDLTDRRVERGGRPVELSDREFDLVDALLRADGGTLSRSEIVERAWGMHFDPGTNVVDVVVMRVRKKLDLEGGHAILTVPGEGYAMRAERVRT